MSNIIELKPSKVRVFALDADDKDITADASSRAMIKIIQTTVNTLVMTRGFAPVEEFLKAELARVEDMGVTDIGA